MEMAEKEKGICFCYYPVVFLVLHLPAFELLNSDQLVKMKDEYKNLQIITFQHSDILSAKEAKEADDRMTVHFNFHLCLDFFYVF